MIPSPVTTMSTRGFITRLLVSVVVINIFVMSLAGFFLLQSRDQYLKRSEIQLQNLTTALELTISGIINTTDLILRTVVDEADNQLKNGTLDWKALSETEERQHPRVPEVTNFQLIQANGDMVAMVDGRLKKLVNIADKYKSC